MATTEMLDYRRADLRTNLFEIPYWISSAEIDCSDAEDLAAVVFSFPTDGEVIWVEQVVLQVTTLLAVTAGAAVVTVGACTIATDIITSGGDTTDVDATEYILNADVTCGTAGFYGPTTGNTSHWLTAKILGSYTKPYYIAGDATNCPCVAVYLTNAGGAISSGKMRIHMCITRVPGL